MDVKKHLTIDEQIEVAIKTRIAYYHSLKYGPLGYLDSNNYNSKFDETILRVNFIS